MSTNSDLNARTTQNAFLTYDLVKSHYSYPDDNRKETKLQIITFCNNEMMRALKDVADLDNYEGSELFIDSRDTAFILYESEYTRQILKQYDEADKIYSRFEKSLVILKGSIKAKETERTKAVLISSDPRDKKVPLPTQYSTYVFDDFA